MRISHQPENTFDVFAFLTSMSISSEDQLVNGHDHDLPLCYETSPVQPASLQLVTSILHRNALLSFLATSDEGDTRTGSPAYAEDSITLLELDSYAEAVVVELGESLNAESWKSD
jgi:ATP-binding cassette subfamily G (WHITE) protein 2 (PDR)